MKKRNKSFIIIFVIVVAAVGLLSYRNFFNTGSGTERVPCNNVAIPDPPNLHWHPGLQIVIAGEKISIPPNLGLDLVCHRVLHTHDEAEAEGGFRLIHLEPDFAQDFTLGDFMSVWKKPFSATQILEKTVDAEHEIVMTVDGAPNTEFENLILKDKQKILIEYKTK